MVDLGTVTLVHLGGARKIYRASLVGLYIHIHIPLGDHRLFNVKTGKPTRKSMRMWRIDDEDRKKFLEEYRRRRIDSAIKGPVKTKPDQKP